MALDLTESFCSADGFLAGLAAAGSSGGQQMQAGNTVASTVAQWLSTSTVQTVS